MARPYIPLAIWNYTPVLRSMPALEINTPTDAPLVCVQFSQHLVPYILGLLEIYRWPDKFSGTEEEVNRSLGVIQDFIVLLTEGNCPDCPGGTMPAVFRFTSGCGLEFSNDNGTTWYPVPGWSSFAETCFKGDTGAPGQDGTDGNDGRDGEDCDCGDPTPTQPVVVVGDDRCQQACNIATGLGKWLHGAHGDSLVFAKQAFEATAIILDVVSDYIDVFPIFGAIVNATVDMITQWKDLDMGALIGVNNNEFREEIQCKLYELMANDTEDFTADYLFQVREQLQDWAVTLPPRGPLLTLIGQSFALFLEQVQAGELLRRANIYKDAGSNCDLCDVECGGECDAPITYNFGTAGAGAQGWIKQTGTAAGVSCGSADFSTATFGGSLVDGVGWRVSETSGGPIQDAIGIRHLYTPTYKLCKARITIGNTSGASNTRYSTLRIRVAGEWQILVCKRLPIGNTGGPTIVWDGAGTSYDVEAIEVDAAVGGQTITITKVELNYED